MFLLTWSWPLINVTPHGTAYAGGAGPGAGDFLKRVQGAILNREGHPLSYQVALTGLR